MLTVAAVVFGYDDDTMLLVPIELVHLNLFEWYKRSFHHYWTSYALEPIDRFVSVAVGYSITMLLAVADVLKKTAAVAVLGPIVLVAPNCVDHIVVQIAAVVPVSVVMATIVVAAVGCFELVASRHIVPSTMYTIGDRHRHWIRKRRYEIVANLNYYHLL